MGQEFVMKNVMLFYDGRCHQILVFRYVFLSALILVCPFRREYATCFHLQCTRSLQL